MDGRERPLVHQLGGFVGAGGGKGGGSHGWMLTALVVGCVGVAVLLVAVAAVVPAGAQDEDAGVHQPAVDALKAFDVFDGTGCGDSGGLCPREPLLRWEMAVWLVRILDGTEPAVPPMSGFADVDGDLWWAAHTERLAELGVTQGCATGPLRFCPDRPVNRGQMAAFLVRAFGLGEGPAAGFGDVAAGHTFAADIDALAAAGVTVGCSADPLRYCPGRAVTRGQMATFLARAIGLVDAPVAEASSFSVLAAGWGYSCGLRTDSTVVCWGYNNDGQTDAPSGGFSAIAAGGLHSCGLRTDSTVVCWGYNNDGQTDAPSGGFSAIAAGGFHSCGLRTDSTVVCWGYNNDGQTDAPSGGFSAIAAGGFHSCGLRTDSTVVCWGYNNDGQTDTPSGGFSAIAAGRLHSCGLRSDGSVVCWGSNDDGKADAVAGTFSAVDAGGSHSCGLRTDSTVACWGNDAHGQSQAPDRAFSAVTAGWDHSCGLGTDSTVACWGSNSDGQSTPPG